MVELIANTTSTLVAVVALFLTFVAERRNHERFQKQIDQSERLAKAAVRPLLGLEVSGYEDSKAIVLQNHGMGTAVIQKIEFRLGRRKAASVPDLLELPREVTWNDFLLAGDAELYVRSQGEITLIEIERDHLLEQGFSPGDADAILEVIEEQLDRLRVVVSYGDVLGNQLAESARVW